MLSERNKNFKKLSERIILSMPLKLINEEMICRSKNISHAFGINSSGNIWNTYI